VSTRRVEKQVEQLGVASLSKSQVSEMAAYLDAQVEAFRNRPLDSGPYTFAWLDALTIKVREAGRMVNVHGLSRGLTRTTLVSDPPSTWHATTPQPCTPIRADRPHALPTADRRASPTPHHWHRCPNRSPNRTNSPSYASAAAIASAASCTSTNTPPDQPGPNCRQVQRSG
jgi:hypothetical protein